MASRRTSLLLNTESLLTVISTTDACSSPFLDGIQFLASICAIGFPIPFSGLPATTKLKDNLIFSNLGNALSSTFPLILSKIDIS